MIRYFFIYILFSIVLFTNSCNRSVEKSFIRYTPKWKTDITKTKAYNSSQNTWEKFRKDFPYHIQTIAIQKFKEDDSYVFILSEPPINLEEREIEKIFKFYNSSLSIKINEIGYDGWTKDVVASVVDLPNNEVSNLVKKLNQLFFKSDYKSDYYVNLPSNEEYLPFNRKNINFDVSSKELSSWFLKNDLKVETLDSQSFYFREIFSNDTKGTLRSKEPGFYFFVYDKYEDLSNFESDLRIFVLDSDIILGVIANSNKVILIARERQVKLTELPPLRVETILQLAAANKEELSQSYERNMLLAGKLSSNRDWAPIYLSNELINTEYGSLLNLTDQMLKSWSLNGDIEYYKWGHKKPPFWGFNYGGVMEELEVNTLTFNWNTTGAVYKVPFNKHDIIAFNRTGSLPISYFPEGIEDEISEDKIEFAEKKGYDFFSTLNNPDLLRVSQYAALYQIFCHFNTYSTQAFNNGKKPRTPPLTKHYEKVYNFIHNLNDQETSQILDEYYSEYEAQLAEMRDSVAAYKYSPYYEDMALNLFYLELSKPDYYGMLDSLRSGFKEVGQFINFDQAAKINSNPRELNYTTIEEEEIIYASLYVQDLITNYFPEELLLDKIGINKNEVMNDYVNSFKNSESNWIKTPSIVLSWSSKDSIYSVGGHSLGSKLTDFKIDKTLKRGQVRVSEVKGKKIIHMSDNDIGNISPKMLRKINKQKTGSFTLGDDLIANLPLRNRESIIPKKTRERGLNDAHNTLSKNTDNFVLNGKKIIEYDELISDISAKLSTAKGKKVELKFEGYSQDEVRASIISSEISLKHNIGMMKLEGGFSNALKKAYKKLDFDNVKITKSPDNTSISVEIPRLSEFGVFRIEITRISKEIIKIIEDVIARVLSRFKKDPTLNFEQELRLELRIEGINPDDLFYQSEFSDVIIGFIYNEVISKFYA